jgi:hypothetical protein
MKESTFSWIYKPKDDSDTPHFTYNRESKQHACTHQLDDGTPCPYLNSTGHSQNMRRHLLRHKIKTPKKTKVSSGQPRLRLTVFPPTTDEENWAILFCLRGWAWRTKEDSVSETIRKQLMPGLPTRQALRDKTISVADRLRDAVLKRMAGPVTIMFDSGTVHERYLVFVVATTDMGCVVRSFRDDDELFGGTKFTSDNIGKAHAEVKKLVEKYGCYATHSVADNAANMQGAVATEQMHRCSAHVLQLAVKDVCEQVPMVTEALEILQNLPNDIKNKLPRAPETRWGYQTRRLLAASVGLCIMVIGLWLWKPLRVRIMLMTIMHKDYGNKILLMHKFWPLAPLAHVRPTLMEPRSSSEPCPFTTVHTPTPYKTPRKNHKRRQCIATGTVCAYHEPKLRGPGFRQVAAMDFVVLETRLKVEQAYNALLPFSVATDIVQADSATLWRSIAAWGQVLDAVPHAVRAVAYERFKYLIRGPYVVLAYFSPSVCLSNFVIENGAAILQAHVRSIVVALDPTAGQEFDTVAKHARRMKKPTCTEEEFFTFVHTWLHPKAPKIAALVRLLALSTPTEAAVERAFSVLKFINNDWRNRLEDDAVEGLLVCSTAYKTLHKVATTLAERDSKSRTPATQASRSQPSAESPAAQAPVEDVVVVDDDADDDEEDDDDDDGDDEGDEGSDDEEAVLVVREACQIILELTVALCARQPVAVPTRPTEHLGPQTRKKADICVICQKPCAEHGTYDHPIKAYLVCATHDCESRVSAGHAEISIPWHNIPNGEQLKKLHKALPSDLVAWMCPKCDLE